MCVGSARRAPNRRLLVVVAVAPGLSVVLDLRVKVSQWLHRYQKVTELDRRLQSVEAFLRKHQPRHLLAYNPEIKKSRTGSQAKKCRRFAMMSKTWRLPPISAT